MVFSMNTFAHQSLWQQPECGMGELRSHSFPRELRSYDTQAPFVGGFDG